MAGQHGAGGGEPGRRGGGLDQRHQGGDRGSRTDQVGLESAAPGGAEDASVGSDEGDVGLAVSRVDGEDAGQEGWFGLVGHQVPALVRAPAVVPAGGECAAGSRPCSG